MDLFECYKRLCKEPEDAVKGWYQNRGYEFEKLISAVLKRDGLSPRTSYKIKGEQIDGSFTLGDRVYLLEAKWHKREMSASDIYEFKGKVDGKLIGTIGVFISISGFSKDSVDALIYGKEINIILFDREDFEKGIKKEGAFKKILLEKIRVAAEEGTPYVPVEIIIDVNSESENTKETKNIPDGNEMEKVAIICEGDTDERLLRIICKRITKKRIIIIKANGIRNIPLLANKILSDREYDKVILVADSDGDEKRVEAMLNEMVEFKGWYSVIINDTIESWFDVDKRKCIGHRAESLRELEKKARENEIDEMKEKHSSFEIFYNLLVD